MNSVVLRSGLIAMMAMAATVVGARIGIRLFGEEPMPSALWLSAVLPLLIGFPIAYVIIKKSDENAKLSASLSDAYKTLSLMHQQLSESSSRDAMTGVFNRETFLKKTSMLHSDGARGALLLIDADHFKSINDKYGHAAGDEALIAIAHAIKSEVRAQDIVGRLGGEEFGVFLLGATDAEAELISERIRHAVQAIEFQPASGANIPLTVSIGGITGSGNRAGGDALQSAMHLADTLLYRAKSSGRNCVVLAAA